MSSSSPSLLPLLLLLPALALLLLTTAAAAAEESAAVRQTGNERPSFHPLNSLRYHDQPSKIVSKEERQARKLLRKKKQRLRLLRDEIRRLGGVSPRGQKLKNRDEKWRRRMLARLDTITKRLDRLETLLMESSASETSKKMERHFASIPRSLNGESGMPCASHRDCRPGRCCHAPSGAAGGGSSVCVRHDASEGVGCTDSCQCTLQLQCFAAKGNTTEPAACKRASSSDILTGTYLNDVNAIF